MFRSMRSSTVVISINFWFPASQIIVSVNNNTQDLALPLQDTVSLTCIVTLPESLLGNVTSIQWKHEGPAVTNQTSTNLTSGSSVLTISLSLLSDAGVYVCNASVSSPYLDIASIHKNASIGVTVQGNFRGMQRA